MKPIVGDKFAKGNDQISQDRWVNKDLWKDIIFYQAELNTEHWILSEQTQFLIDIYC